MLFHLKLITKKGYRSNNRIRLILNKFYNLNNINKWDAFFLQTLSHLFKNAITADQIMVEDHVDAVNK